MEKVGSGMHGWENYFKSNIKFLFWLVVKAIMVEFDKILENSKSKAGLHEASFWRCRGCWEKRNVFWCNVFGFVAASLVDLFSALLPTISTAGAAICPCSGHVGKSKISVYWPPFLIFSDLEWSCGLTGRHGCYGRIKNVRYAHNRWNLRSGGYMDLYFWRKTTAWGCFYRHFVIRLSPVACNTPGACILSWRA